MTATHTADYERADGRAARLTYAQPDGATRGGLVVLHPAEGVTDSVKFLVGSLADEGWQAAAPHLTGTSADEILAATDITLAWLVEHGVGTDLLGVVGFDLGGTAALVVAASRELGAAVSVGGRGITAPASAELPALVDIAGSLRSPWLGIYGDTGDEASAAEVARLTDAASAARVATEVVRYPGANHRFDADPDAAAEAWQRTLNWFDAFIR